MKAIIAEGTPEEIAALVVQTQEPQSENDHADSFKLDGKKLTKAVFKDTSPVYDYIISVHETTEIAEAARLLATNDWVVIAIAKGKNGAYLFSLGKVR